MGWGSDNLFHILGLPPTTSPRDLRRAIEQLETMAQLGIDAKGLTLERLTEFRRIAENVESLMRERFQAPLVPQNPHNQELFSTFDTSPKDVAALQVHDAWVRSITDALAAPGDASLLKEALNATVSIFKDDTIWRTFSRLTGSTGDSRTDNAIAKLRSNRDALVINPLLNSLEPRNQSATIIKKSVSAVRSSKLADRDKNLVADKLTIGLRDRASDCAAEVGKRLEQLRGPGIRDQGLAESTRILLAERCIPAFAEVSNADPKRKATTENDAFVDKLRRIAEAYQQTEGRELFVIALLAEAVKLVKSPVARGQLVEFHRSFREWHHENQAQECADAGDHLSMLAHIRIYQTFLPAGEDFDEDAIPLDWDTADRYLRGEFDHFGPEEVDFRIQAIETDIALCLSSPKERDALEKKRQKIEANLAKENQIRLKREAEEKQERARKEAERLRVERELREAEENRLEQERRRAEERRLERERILAEEQRERQRQLEEQAARKERDRIDSVRRRQELRTSIRHEIGRGFWTDLIAASFLALVLVGIAGLVSVQLTNTNFDTASDTEVAQPIPTPTPKNGSANQAPTSTVGPPDITEVAAEPTPSPSNPTTTAAASQASGLEGFDIAKRFSTPASWCSGSARGGFGAYTVTGPSQFCDWAPEFHLQPKGITLNVVKVQGSGSLYVFARNAYDGKLWIYRVNFSEGLCTWSVTYESHIRESQVVVADTQVEPHGLPASTKTSSDACPPMPGRRTLTISLDVYSKRPSFRVNGVDVARSYTPDIPIPDIANPDGLGFGIESDLGEDEFSVEFDYYDLDH